MIFMKKETLNIKGMHCSSCVNLIQDTLKNEGVTAKVDLIKNKAEISYNEKKISLNQIIKIIKDEGYQASQ